MHHVSTKIVSHASLWPLRIVTFSQIAFPSCVSRSGSPRWLQTVIGYPGHVPHSHTIPTHATAGQDKFMSTVVSPTTLHPQVRFETSTCHHNTHLELARVSHDLRLPTRVRTCFSGHGGRGVSQEMLVLLYFYKYWCFQCL
jgi:hypothetical protein